LKTHDIKSQQKRKDKGTNTRNALVTGTDKAGGHSTAFNPGFSCDAQRRRVTFVVGEKVRGIRGLPGIIPRRRTFFSRSNDNSSKRSRACVFDHEAKNRGVVNESDKRGSWVL
jgi:hypothetical protein